MLKLRNIKTVILIAVAGFVLMLGVAPFVQPSYVSAVADQDLSTNSSTDGAWCSNDQFASEPDTCQSEYGVPECPQSRGTVSDPIPFTCPFSSKEAIGFCKKPSDMPDNITLTCIDRDNKEVVVDNTSQPVASLLGIADLAGDCQETDINQNNCGIIAYLVDFINILSGLVGIVCVIMIAVWGIQYTVARDNPQMVAQARQRMVQTVLALVGYLFVYAFLQWVVPGGVLPG